ncbi:cysteine/serine endopeptidase inhibitor [Kitasatospora sp. HPMI-4]|uniref:cysteine/serine endopeptidase inhibitor n=1 Tax=Kitasatospora sp. HPMI-4 TaxID=3448443 RepID=UPI003F1B889A
MHGSRRVRQWSSAALAAGAFAMLSASPALADIPFNQPINGIATYYGDAGYGACGTPINASQDMLVAVSPAYWTTANSNNDPLCQGVSVQVTYNGATVTVPVADKCASCDPTHVDLSQPAFQQLADPSLGFVNVTWQFVSTGGGAASAKAVAALNARATGATSHR